MSETWKCHAIPAATSSVCGFVNTTGVTFRGMTCCESCGCTKKASDDRQKRKR